MDIASVVKVALQASIVASVVSLGFQVKIRDIVEFVSMPRRLCLALLAVVVVMPVVAVLLARTMGLHPPVTLALIALSLSPIPPILPMKQLRAGGTQSYVFGLLVTVALSAIIVVPIGIEVIEWLFDVPLQMAPLDVAKVVLLTVLGPLGFGMLLGNLLPAFVDKIARPLAQGAMVLLTVGALLILVKFGPAMLSLLGHGTIIAFALFILTGLAVGHLLGGTEPGDRGTLAFATATRHPGVALTIAGINFPDQKLALPAVLIYILLGIALSVPYMKWLGRSKATVVA